MRLRIDILASLFLLLLVQCRAGSGDVEFTLTFKQAKDLRPGQFVTYKGVRIGEINAVDVDSSGSVQVEVKIDEKYRGQVYKEASFRIEKLSPINPTGEHQVTMSDVGTVRTPIENGTIIAGNEGWVGEALTKAKDVFRRGVEVATTAAESAIGEAAAE